MAAVISSGAPSCRSTTGIRSPEIGGGEVLVGMGGGEVLVEIGGGEVLVGISTGVASCTAIEQPERRKTNRAEWSTLVI
jgi:hypothetical protein